MNSRRRTWALAGLLTGVCLGPVGCSTWYYQGTGMTDDAFPDTTDSRGHVDDTNGGRVFGVKWTRDETQSKAYRDEQERRRREAASKKTE